VPDAQAAYETAITAMLPALAGVNLIYGLGMLELGVTFDYAQLMIDSDIAEMILFSLGGIPVNDETLAVEDIIEVGPLKDFLTHKSTFKNRKSQSYGPITDRHMRGNWLKKGGQDMTQRALERARHILRNHQPLPLPEEARLALRAFVNEEEKKRGLPLSKDDFKVKKAS
jgi:trimethylamine--corrinoid protein Co-methyltransferase